MLSLSVVWEQLLKYVTLVIGLARSLLSLINILHER